MRYWEGRFKVRGGVGVDGVCELFLCRVIMSWIGMGLVIGRMRIVLVFGGVKIRVRGRR